MTRELSATSVESNRFVAERIDAARALGERLAGLAADPDAFVAAVERGFAEIADPSSLDGLRRVTPGIGEALGVRLPLMDAANKAFRRGTRTAPPAQLLHLVELLLERPASEVRWFGMWNLERLLPADPDGTWTLMRRAASSAGEWITVDTLAHPYGAGILRDPARWAELDRLVESKSRWERRLVGSTLATMPHVKLTGAKDPRQVPQGLGRIERLMGDPEPDVQKALSWALRTYADIDSAAVVAFIDREVMTACRENDGNRAWVIRDTLPKLPEHSEGLRQILAGIRRSSAKVA
jgi:hypothetical protein